MKDNNKPWYEKISIWITIIAGICAILGISIFGNIPLFNDNEQEIHQLLDKAEKYYYEEEYDKMMSIYSDKKMQSNPLALLNIGVLYANGVYFPSDKQQAILYFNKALEEGETYYSILYLMQLYSFEDLSEIQRIIKIGCSNNNKYCEKILKALYQQSGLICDTFYLSDFNAKNDEEKNEIISKVLDLMNQYKYKVATNYSYTVYNDENGELHIDAEATEIEERAINMFINDYFKIDGINMVFQQYLDE